MIEPDHKGFPASAVGRSVAELRGLGLGPGGFDTPVLLLREDALAHNLQALQRFCDEAGLSVAPHVKTTMSPEIIARQLAAGAWAVTVATPTQLRTLRWLGAPRILLANPLVDPDAIAWLAAERDDDPGFEAYCYVDSTTGMELLAASPGRRELPVLVELGVPGGRTGVRDVAEAVDLARRVAGAPGLRLAGVAGFEGIIDTGLVDVAAYLRRLRELADRVAGDVAGELVVTAGGTAYPELVREVFDGPWRDRHPARVVLRSGCYVTHDSGGYQRLRTVVAAHYIGRQRAERSGARGQTAGIRRNTAGVLDLVPALELWGRVLSCPEPGLAVVDVGRRDTGTDAGSPVPQYLLRAGETTVEPAPAARVAALNDQHAYLTGVDALAVGDLVGFGISHPCTTFDKWRLIPVVDPDRRLVGAVSTRF